MPRVIMTDSVDAHINRENSKIGIYVFGVFFCVLGIVMGMYKITVSYSYLFIVIGIMMIVLNRLFSKSYNRKYQYD